MTVISEAVAGFARVIQVSRTAIERELEAGSYLAFDVDATEGSRTCVLKHRPSLASQEANLAIVFPFNKMLAPILTDEVEALP